MLAVMALALVLGAGAGRGVATAATLGTIVVLFLGYRTGQAGGSLVYRHGAAQAYVAGGGGPAPVIGHQGHDGDD